MNKIFRPLAPVFLILTFSCLARADDFKSLVIAGDEGATPTPLPRIHGNQLMVIRNFTQDASTSTTSGVVTITKPPGGASVSVLTSAILDPANPPEIINSVVIAGPADVSVTCGASSGSNCFISFKKISN